MTGTDGVTQSLPTMAPERIMAAFEVRGALPRAALRAAGESREAMVPVFLERIDRLIEADAERFDEDLSFIFVYHLLAEWRETRAYRPMLRLLRRDPDFLDALMGDGITECTGRVMVSLFDGDPEPMIEAVLDGAADAFVRSALLEALVALALDRPALRPAVEGVVRRFPAAAGQETPDILLGSWALAVADLGLADMAPAVRAAYDDDLIDEALADWQDFERHLQQALATGRPTHLGASVPITDAAEELSQWPCFSKAYLDAVARIERRVPLPAVSAPKVGRNDPCPCGSGKKFKKCCLT